jgi:hypothetical protein
MTKTGLAKTTNNQKRQPTKIPGTKTDFANRNHKRTRAEILGNLTLGGKPTKPTKPRQFHKLNLPKLLQKKDKPILRTYQTNHEEIRSHETKPIKTNADQN